MQAIKIDGFLANISDNETNYVFSTYQKCVELFSILFKQELERNVSKVLAKFERVSYIRFYEFWSGSWTPLSFQLLVAL